MKTSNSQNMIIVHFVGLAICLLAGLVAGAAANLFDIECSSTKPCETGCCSINGFCGFGPKFCAQKNCTGNCDAVAECGQYADPAHFACPLNLCCADFGLCGTGPAFCNDRCQNKGGCSDSISPYVGLLDPSFIALLTITVSVVVSPAQ